MLDTQYRMHPTIAAFSSWRFYRGQLRNGVTAVERPGDVLFGTDVSVVVVHVEGSEAGAEGRSKSNRAEARCCTELVLRLSERDVGVIAPYAAQVPTTHHPLPTTH